MRNVKIIRIDIPGNNAHPKMTIQGILGGRLDIDFSDRAAARAACHERKTERIMAYLPPFVKSLVLETNGLLVNSEATGPFRVHVLDSGNSVLDTIIPEKIGESSLWQCKMTPSVFNKMQKLIIH